MTLPRAGLVTAAALAMLGAPALFAAVPVGLDAAPSALTPIGTPALDRDGAAPSPLRARGNPLWGIPLSILTATRERPIFLPTRRPVAPIVAAPHVVPVEPVAAPPAPEPPRLALVGAIVGEDEREAIAIILDQATNSIVRLRIGQMHGAWALTAVRGRTATLEKGDETLRLELPAPGSAAAFAGPGTLPGLVVPATTAGSAGGAGQLVIPDPSMGAPYVPRSTPKSGESDGL